ncbi:hypothetical protein B0T25DRAFT_461829 [Lasiosphaeria hispida]|uniref:Uncharacterized protein n=1 Tax=Lasiosphaeria hispida TaxID=260671 RepID=A0AAJ0MAS6_9PEZI|nr:hypothetical protein B0T25DRAFT_461829 [Lasiosphaeria hispida]
MELARVDALVDGLASAFESGLDFYTKWKKQLETQNHYRRHDKSVSPSASKCAVSTSLDISSHRIKATYQVGFALIGPSYAVGDADCRQVLTTSLAQIEERVDGLRQALGSKQRHFINLNEMFLVSESIRIKCVTALADQYKRYAAGRAVPQDMPIPRPRSMCRQDEQAPPPIRVLPARPPHDDFDRHTAIWSTNSEMPIFQSEPPSPPLTPKLMHDDMESCTGAPSEFGQPNPRQSMRPKNSVFSIFCSEAMALQVDPARPIPTTSRGRCTCGYKWNVPELSKTKNYLAVKDGFRVTKRFLAKSHCDQSADEGVAIAPSADQPKPGYGCVLCTSTGRTETYETPGTLRAHINATHDKWQMLHDRDMTKGGYTV